jgi:hypothetical protein
MRRCAPLLAALLLAGSSPLLYAIDCAKARDPKGCEERRAKIEERLAKMDEAREKARKACQGKAGDERRECMAKSFCAQAKDPARCEASLKERAERRREPRAGAKGKEAR